MCLLELLPIYRLFLWWMLLLLLLFRFLLWKMCSKSTRRWRWHSGFGRLWGEFLLSKSASSSMLGIRVIVWIVVFGLCLISLLCSLGIRRRRRRYGKGKVLPILKKNWKNISSNWRGFGLLHKWLFQFDEFSVLDFFLANFMFQIVIIKYFNFPGGSRSRRSRACSLIKYCDCHASSQRNWRSY